MHFLDRRHAAVCLFYETCSSSDTAPLVLSYRSGLCNGAWYVTHCDCGPDGWGYKDLITPS